MGKQLLVLLSGIFFSVFLIRNAHYFQYGAAETSVLSARAPDFSWPEAGKTQHLADFSGKPIIVHFWASWCEPCKEELPDLFKAAADQSTVFVLVAADEDPEKARALLAALKAPHLPNLHYVFDADKKIVYDLYQTGAYPETIFIDAHHHMRRKLTGIVDWHSDAVQAMLRKMRE